MPDSLSVFDGCVGRALDTEGKDNTRVSISAVSGKRLPSGQKSRSARPNTLMNCRRRQRTDVTHINAFHRGPAQGNYAAADFSARAANVRPLFMHIAEVLTG